MNPQFIPYADRQDYAPQSIQAWKKSPDLVQTSLKTNGNAPKSRPYGFKDVLDIINPLHHLPLIGPLYRKFTGDSLHPASRIIGGSVFGGPMGMVSASVQSVREVQQSPEYAFKAQNSYTRYSFAEEPRTAGMDRLA